MKRHYILNEDFFDTVDSEMVMASVSDDVEDIESEKKYDYDCVIIVSSISSSLANSNDIAVEEAIELLRRLKHFLDSNNNVDIAGTPVVYSNWFDIDSSDLIIHEYPQGLNVYHKKDRYPYITNSFGIRVPLSLKKITSARGFIRFCKNFLGNSKNLSKKLSISHIKLKNNKTDEVISFDTSLYSEIKQASETNALWNNLQRKSELYNDLTILCGTGSIQQLRDCLGVNDDLRIIDELKETCDKRKRKKVFECSVETSSMNIDLFANYAYILANKDIRMIYSVSGYDTNMTPFIATWEGFADLLREQNGSVRAYLFYKSITHTFIAVYILSKTVYDDEMEMDYCLVCEMPENQCYKSDYRCGNIADFLTPFVVMGNKLSKILSKPSFSYLDDSEKDDIHLMIENNIKKGMV